MFTWTCTKQALCGSVKCMYNMFQCALAIPVLKYCYNSWHAWSDIVKLNIDNVSGTGWNEWWASHVGESKSSANFDNLHPHTCIGHYWMVASQTWRPTCTCICIYMHYNSYLKWITDKIGLYHMDLGTLAHMDPCTLRHELFLGLYTKMFKPLSSLRTIVKALNYSWESLKHMLVMPRAWLFNEFKILNTRCKELLRQRSYT